MACHVAAPRAYHEYRARSQVGELIQKDSNYPTTSNMLAVMLPDQKPAIRLAREEELREAGTIVALSFESFRAALPPHILEPYMADASDLTAVSEEAQVVVAERGGELAGTVTYYEDAGREGMGWPSSFAGLRTLAVSTSVQGRGVGRALCEWCIARAREQGAEALALHTAEFMVAACRIYESLGFQRWPSHDLLASDVLGFNPMLGDQRIIAYSLPISSALKGTPVADA